MTKINEESCNGVIYTVQVSYLEIYQEKIRDLLAEDDVDEEAKPPSGTQPSLASSGMNGHEKVRFSGSNSELKLRVPGHNVEEKVRLYSKSLEEKISSYTGSLTENSYTSSFLNKAALQRQLEAAQKHSKIKCERERSLENPHCNPPQDVMANKVRSPSTKPAFDTVFNKQKIHKHYRTFPTVMEEAPPVRKQNFLRIREHPMTGPFVEGLLWKDVCSWYDMENLMKQGSISRTTAATDMNEKSSRSHAVFSIRLTKNHVPDLFGLHPSTVNYINLVDLAGSEKQSKLCSGAVSGERTQEESRCINRSLSQLNEVILSLSTSRFVSYRNSILTWLLKESLGGNSRTFMVANISPTEKDLRESINTLRYATTASRIPPPVALDQDPRNKLIKILKEEICALRSLLSSFTSVKENAPSDQLPSLQKFKVPCLDVGLQVERNGSHNDGNFGKEPRGLLDKGSQTENLLRDVGQQSIARTGRADAGFQIGLKDGTLDMGNPTALQDSGTVDIGHQTLILNVCGCDFGHQASAKEFGVLDVGLQATLRELGAVTVSQQSTLIDCCGAKDVRLHFTPQSCSSVDVGNEVTLQHWGDVDSRQQRPLPRGAKDDASLPVMLHNRADVPSRNAVALQDRDAVDTADQITKRCFGEATPGYRFLSQNRVAINAGNQRTMRDSVTIDAGNQVSLRGWGNVDVGNQTILRSWGDVDAESQIALGDWGPIDIGLETSCKEIGAVDVGNHVTTRDWELTDATHQINLGDCGSKDAGHQTKLEKNGRTKATDCTTVQLDMSHQTDWRNFGASDCGIQDVIISDNGQHKVMLRDSGRTDLGLPNWWNGDGCNLGHFTKDCRITVQDSLDEGLGEQTGRKIDKVDELLSLYEFGTHGNQDVRQQPLGRKLERVDELRSLYESRAQDNEDVRLKTAKRKVEKVDKLISLYESRTYGNSSPMASGKALAGDSVNPLVNRNNGAVEVGHPNNKMNLGAINSGCGATPKVSMVKERKAQFEPKNLSVLHFGHQRAPQGRPGISVGQGATPKGIGPVCKGHQASSKDKDVNDQEFPVDRKQSDVETGYEISLLDCEGATEVKRQIKMKCLEGIDAGLQTSWNKKVAKEPQLGQKDDAGLESRCQAAFEDNSSSRLRHKSTSTDFTSLGVDENSLYTYKAVESWKHFRCRACGATLGNSMVVVSPLVPIQEVTAYVGLQTSWVDLFVTACELQTPTSGCQLSSDVDQITPKVFEAVDESGQVHWEELNPFHEQHYRTCWNRFGESDLTCQQDFPKVSRSLDRLEESRSPGNNPGDDAHVGPQNHREACSNCNTGCQNCEQDYVVKKWQHHVRQEGGQGCQNWLHLHEIVLSEPSYMLTESDADTRNPDEDASWNAIWANKHQNPQGHRDDGKGLAFLKDVKLKRLVRSNNSGGLQCRDCRSLDKNSQAFPSVAIAEVEQQQPAGDLGPLEGQNRSTEEMVDSVSTRTQILNKGDEELFDSVSAKTQNIKKEQEVAISRILQTQTKEEDTSRACEFSLQTHIYSYRFSMPAEDLETHRGYQERDQHLDGKMVTHQDSICLSLLREFRRGRKKKSDNVPAEEAFHLCSLWTLAKLKSRMEWYTIHSEKDCLKFGISLATKGPGLISQPHVASRAEVATQTDSCPESCIDHKLHRSNVFQHICLLWVFVVLRIAAPGRGGSLRDRRLHAGERPPLLAAAASGPRKIRILSCLSGSKTDEKGPMMSRREYRPPKSKHLRYSGVEPLTFRSTTPFFIQTSGDCSLLRSTRVDRGPRLGNNAATAAGGRYHQIMCGFRSRRDVHFLKEGVNRLGSDRAAHIFVTGLSEDHTEFIYMPADRCLQRKGYVVARLVAPEAMAFLNGLPMLEHKELCTGDVLVLRDLRHRSSVCTLHFFDLVKFS